MFHANAMLYTVTFVMQVRGERLICCGSMHEKCSRQDVSIDRANETRCCPVPRDDENQKSVLLRHRDVRLDKVRLTG
ncbi:hypothetical protein L210DRAFT_2129509 [Boletus edulis BED1]|uniref:Uncharacterized protein n=1 Tax=Boletus edulis BED1 TaxID=1328754 RepID=A0AAD4BEM9_BOLED|nr:hypothetical protein L210DRAFT_2129509 [Boletus edulis BED1]